MLDEEYNPIIKSYHVPAVPPVLPPTNKTMFKKPKIFIPPPLRFRFPFNLFVYATLPIVFPLFLTAAITKLSLDSKASNKRTRELEKSITDGSKVAYIRALFKDLEEQGAAMLAEGVEEFTHQEDIEASSELGGEVERSASPTGSSGSGDLLEQSQRMTEFAATAASSSSPAVDDKTAIVSPSQTTSPSPSRTSSNNAKSLAKKSKSKSSSLAAEKKGDNPYLSPVQVKMAASLNALPQLKKQLVYITGGVGPDGTQENDAHGHAIVVARDLKNPTHQKGLGVVRHWADHFVM